MRPMNEAGFSLPELLIGVLVFSLVSVGLYMTMVSSTRHADVAETVAEVSNEARLGINRMLRETREADGVLCAPTCPTSTSYTIAVDYNQDGAYETPNSNGSYEQVTFTYDSANQRILIQAGGITETLVSGVQQITGRDVFSYTSNRYEYNRTPSPSGSPDGKVTWQEIDATTAVGNNSGTLDSSEIGYVTNVLFQFRVASGSRSGDFYAEAQMRNRR